MGIFKLRNKEMEKTIEKVFNRQFERMKNELFELDTTNQLTIQLIKD